jgi:hypothetical protein
MSTPHFKAILPIIQRGIIIGDNTTNITIARVTTRPFITVSRNVIMFVYLFICFNSLHFNDYFEKKQIKAIATPTTARIPRMILRADLLALASCGESPPCICC